MKSLENRIPPPVVVAILGGAMWSVAHHTVHVRWPDTVRIAVITCLVVLGLAIGRSGFRAFAALAGVIVFFVFIWRFQILPEERVLGAKFGDPYAQYLRQVRRWL